MKSIHSLAGVLLVLGFVQGSWQVPLQEADDSSRKLKIFEADDTLADEAPELSSTKRHSEGTFSNDYSKFLEEKKAQDFVQWLMNNKRSGSNLCVCVRRAEEKRHADGTFTSDVSSYLKEQAIKDFVDKLKSGKVRRDKRHVDGSFTSDVNKVLDSLAAKEYLLWVMTSKPSGESFPGDPGGEDMESVILRGTFFCNYSFALQNKVFQCAFVGLFLDHNSSQCVILDFH
uniref:Glucagon a n=1 Tax=Gasterosteus aculeatus TaxID=69293 RepID=G3PL47_GASAC